jgi:hypothetical protein
MGGLIEGAKQKVWGIVNEVIARWWLANLDILLD